MSGTSGDLQKILEGPDDAALAAEDKALLDLARQAFAELGKLVKNIQLYGPEHQASHGRQDHHLRYGHNEAQRQPQGGAHNKRCATAQRCDQANQGADDEKVVAGGLHRF